jgi:DNA-directed RNA polymerase specialized sigma24 family protein
MGAEVFPETVWPLVLAATDQKDPERAQAAFRELCGAYRQPIFRWMCSVGLNPHDAEDSTQEFLHKWLQRGNPLVGFQRRERRFREFLSVCLRRYLSDRRDSALAQKRGTGVVHSQLEDDSAASPEEPPGVSLDLELARFLHTQALVELTSTWTDRIGAPAWMQVSRLAFDGEDGVPQAVIAGQLACPLNTLKGWILRLRREHFERFRGKAMLLALPTDSEFEVVYLLGLLKEHGLSQTSSTTPFLNSR